MKNYAYVNNIDGIHTFSPFTENYPKSNKNLPHKQVRGESAGPLVPAGILLPPLYLRSIDILSKEEQFSSRDI